MSARTRLTARIRDAERAYLEDGLARGSAAAREWLSRADAAWRRLTASDEGDDGLECVSVALRYQREEASRLALAAVLAPGPRTPTRGELLRLALAGGGRGVERACALTRMIGDVCPDPMQTVRMRALAAVLDMAAGRYGDALDGARETLSFDPSDPWAAGLVDLLPEPAGIRGMWSAPPMRTCEPEDVGPATAGRTTTRPMMKGND